MRDADSVPNRHQEFWMLGPIPPPVTGMTVLTQEMLRSLKSAGPVHFLNWSPGMQQRNLRMRLMRNWRIVKSLVKLIVRGRVDGIGLYTVSNAGSGLFATAFVVLVARMLGYFVYLHHHVYSYIDQYDLRMAWIVRCLGTNGVHIVHADKMVSDFRCRYRIEADFAVVWPSFVPVEIGIARTESHRPFRLGLLSNLSPAKGLDTTIGLFETLLNEGWDVTLTLAGAANDRVSRNMIQKTLATYAARVHHIGLVTGDKKRRFYSNIDAFIFPTMSESWGLVLHEAMAAGVPVIAYDRGCTSIVVGKHAGLVISPSQSFIEHASTQVKNWMNDQDEYSGASKAAILQSHHLHMIGQRTLMEFVAHVFPPTGTAVSPASG